MKTSCRDCVHAKYQTVKIGTELLSFQQNGCAVNRLSKFDKENKSEEISEEVVQQWYELDGFCNLCMTKEVAKKLGVNSSEDAMNLLKVSPWAFVVTDKNHPICSETLVKIKDLGFKKICLIYVGIEADYALVVESLPKNFNEFKLIWLNNDESTDFAIDHAFNQVKPHSYVVFLGTESVRSDYLDHLNNRLTDGETVLMVDSGVDYTGFWILGILHKAHNGNAPNDDGAYLAEKIRNTAATDNQSHLIVKLEDL